MPLQSLAVFCGSKNGVNKIYLKHAIELGRIMASHNITLVYGGGSVGIMGTIADEVLLNGGKVIGVIPQVLVDWEREHKSLSELLVVDNMHTRKKKCMISVMLLLFLPEVLARWMKCLKW